MKILEKLLTLYHSLRKHRAGWYQEIDDRNFGGPAIAGDITRADLNGAPFQNIIINHLIDQAYTDFCVACGDAYQAEGTEGKPMSWRGAYALFCKYIGGVPAYGASILKMLLSRVKYGIPERSLCEFDSSKGRDWNADPRNLTGDAIGNALEHKAESVWEALRPVGWDRFDTFRAWLWKFHDKKIVIQTGIDSHNVTLIGQAYHPNTGELCLFGPDSYGEKDRYYRVGYSYKGYRYWTRAEANQLPTGNFVFDIPVDLAKLLNLYNEKAIKTADSPDCYIIRNQQRHSLVNEEIAWANNTLLIDPYNVSIITKEEMDIIPLGEPVKFRDGKNWQIIRRILEKYEKIDILNNIDK